MISKWIYRIKRNVNRNIACYKAKWVVKGYFQQFGVNLNQTFTVTVKSMAFKVFFIIAAFFDLDIN